MLENILSCLSFWEWKKWKAIFLQGRTLARICQFDNKGFKMFSGILQAPRLKAGKRNDRPHTDNLCFFRKATPVGCTPLSFKRQPVKMKGPPLYSICSNAIEILCWYPLSFHKVLKMKKDCNRERDADGCVRTLEVEQKMDGIRSFSKTCLTFLHKKKILIFWLGMIPNTCLFFAKLNQTGNKMP